MYKNVSYTVPNDNIIHLTISSNDIHTFNLNFESNTKLVVESNNNQMSLDGNNLIYKIGDDTVGSVKVKLSDNYLTPRLNSSGKYEYVFDKYTEDFEVVAEVTPMTGYNTGPSYFYANSSSSFPGDKILHLTISSNNTHNLDFSFESSGGNQNNDGQEPDIFIDFTINECFLKMFL